MKRGRKRNNMSDRGRDGEMCMKRDRQMDRENDREKTVN